MTIEAVMARLVEVIDLDKDDDEIAARVGMVARMCGVSARPNYDSGELYGFTVSLGEELCYLDLDVAGRVAWYTEEVAMEMEDIWAELGIES